MGLCVDAFLLPIGMTPLIRITRTGPKYHDGSIRILGAFEDGFDDWSLDGDAVTNHRDHEGEYEQQLALRRSIEAAVRRRQSYTTLRPMPRERWFKGTRRPKEVRAVSRPGRIQLPPCTHIA